MRNRKPGIALAAVWLCVLGCAGWRGGPASEPPARCIPEGEWVLIEFVDAARVACDDPASPLELARCDREDYLEAVCIGVNAYRLELVAED